MQTPPEHIIPVRENIHWNKQHFGTRQKSCVAYRPAFQGLFTWRWGTPVQWGWLLLFSLSGGHKTKENYPTRPGSPTPCKQGLTLQIAHTLIRDQRLSKKSREKFEKDSNLLTFQQFHSRNLIISNVTKVGGKRVVKEMITGSLSLPSPFSRPANFSRAFYFRFFHYLRAWNRLTLCSPTCRVGSVICHC